LIRSSDPVGPTAGWAREPALSPAASARADELTGQCPVRLGTAERPLGAAGDGDVAARSRSMLATVRPTSSLTRRRNRPVSRSQHLACRPHVRWWGGGRRHEQPLHVVRPERQHPTRRRSLHHELRRVARVGRQMVASDQPAAKDRASPTRPAAGWTGQMAPRRSTARSRTSTSPSSVMTYCQPSSECGGNAGTSLGLDLVDGSSPPPEVRTSGPVRVAGSREPRVATQRPPRPHRT
jgi:hypothetical protein